MTKKRIHQVYSWVLTLGLFLAGFLLIRGCVGIYQQGDRPFSPEAVAVAFSQISVPIYIVLALIAGSFLLQLCLPWEDKILFSPQYPMQLARLQKKLDLTQVTDDALRTQIQTLRKKRLVHSCITYGLLILCSGIFLWYGLNPANFHQSEINHSMAMAMLLFFPCLAVPFGYGCFAAFYGLKLTKAEIDLTRQALRDTESRTVAEKKCSLVTWLRVALLCVGIFLLAYGFFTGGTADVLTKAINICTECVGLG